MIRPELLTDEIHEAAGTDTAADREHVKQALEVLSISELFQLVRADWQSPYFGAVPYIDSLIQLTNLDDGYGVESGRELLPYFLSNATTWRGPVARAVKAELKRRLKA